MRITGAFNITEWNETTTQTFSDGSKLTEARVAQSYNGVIEGAGKLTYQMHYRPDGNASFVGYEVLEGMLNNEKISWVLMHQGQFEKGVASSQCVVQHDLLTDTAVYQKGGFTSGKDCEAEYYFE